MNVMDRIRRTLRARRDRRYDREHPSFAPDGTRLGDGDMGAWTVGGRFGQPVVCKNTWPNEQEG